MQTDIQQKRDQMELSMWPAILGLMAAGAGIMGAATALAGLLISVLMRH